MYQSKMKKIQLLYQAMKKMRLTITRCHILTTLLKNTTHNFKNISQSRLNEGINRAHKAIWKMMIIRGLILIRKNTDFFICRIECKVLIIMSQRWLVRHQILILISMHHRHEPNNPPRTIYLIIQCQKTRNKVHRMLKRLKFWTSRFSKRVRITSQTSN